MQPHPHDHKPLKPFVARERERDRDARDPPRTTLIHFLIPDIYVARIVLITHFL